MATAAQLAPCDYKTGRVLGQGSYATVKEAVRIQTGERFAVKVISKKLMAGRESMILNEIEILKRVSLGHPNIVTLHDYFETPNNLYLVMDLCLGGELFDKIVSRGQFFEADAADIVYVICDAINYLHSQNIVHRDIKPENLLFKASDEASELVISDFGLSKIVASDSFEGLMTTCGTPGYMAPEVIRKTGHGRPVDMWSIGVLTYFLLCGYTPFDGSSQVDEMQNILTANFHFEPHEYWDEVSDDAKDFIRNLLLVNPSSRLTAAQALEHSFLSNARARKLGEPENITRTSTETSVDLLPNVRKEFDARRTFKKAVGAIKAANRLGSLASLVKHSDDAMDEDGHLMIVPKQG
ncbi:CAMK/CAMK1 protein kinase [Polychytrium aggregatum]|uniref:CAMK/CAMK1 protein kinase n=1 Tax=Polychytrium aggregatum TaxID=110093 RepID=UPI0022FEDDE9|nr:CAMK/CAMK1 protein kinase [Polychytrium aggregatum]KAI9203216.1 CAMK/CAMK1 protein kinase [Polychytrium aggregatum]